MPSISQPCLWHTQALAHTPTTVHIRIMITFMGHPKITMTTFAAITATRITQTCALTNTIATQTPSTRIAIINLIIAIVTPTIVAPTIAIWPPPRLSAVSLASYVTLLVGVSYASGREECRQIGTMSPS